MNYLVKLTSHMVNSRLYGETIRTRSDLNSSTTHASFSATTCSATTSPDSLYHIEPNHTVTTTIVDDDHSRTDKLLRKVLQNIKY